MFKCILSLSFSFLLLGFYYVTFCPYKTYVNQTISSDRSVEHIYKISENTILKFNTYLKKYNRSYIEVEYNKRLRNFVNSLKEIYELNKNSNGTAVYGLTKFSDVSKEDFSQKLLSGLDSVPSCQQRHITCPTYTSFKYNFTDELPAQIDWRDKGVVGEVLDQKLCPVCWAFSIVGVMESMNAIKSNNFIRLSIQKLLDCVPPEPPHGCHMKSVDTVLRNMCHNNVIVPREVDYPLTLKYQNCEEINRGWKISVFQHDCDISERYLLQLIAFHGPVVAVVNAATWQYYNDGVIYTNCDGALKKINHAIQIVGYDLTGSVPYYLVRNSWGTDFGAKGYVKLGIYNNVCGITRAVASIRVSNYI